MIDADPASIGIEQLAGRLREAGITIVCTPVSITLDTGAVDPEPEPASAERGGQFLPPIPEQRQATRKPPPKPFRKRE